MTRQKIIIRLTSEEKDTLNSVISKGTSRAHILLKSNDECDKQYTIDEPADLLNTSKQKVFRASNYIPKSFSIFSRGQSCAGHAIFVSLLFPFSSIAMG